MLTNSKYPLTEMSTRHAGLRPKKGCQIVDEHPFERHTFRQAGKNIHSLLHEDLIGNVPGQFPRWAEHRI